MKYFFCLILLLAVTAAKAQYAQPCDEIPALNKAILDVLKPYLGKKIDRGECWDAAKLALNATGADWDGLYDFGRAIDVKTECIQPGDIVQFENVALEVREGNRGYTESFVHHTAIVYKVDGPGKVQLIHQNTGQYGRKMGITPLDLSTITKGTITFYRPEKKN